MIATNRLWLLCLVSFLFAACPFGTADSISFGLTGSGYQGSTSDGLSVNGGTVFSAFSAAPDGPTYLGFGTVGVPMDFGFTPFAWPGQGFADVTIGSFATDILRGGLSIDGTYTVTPADLAAGSFTIPISVYGQLFAYRDLTYGTGSFTQGPLYASLDLGGQGTATFDISSGGGDEYVVYFGYARFTGTGTLTTVTPEPTSLLLVGTGLTGLAFKVRYFRNATRKKT